MECVMCDGKTKIVNYIDYAGTVYRKRVCQVCNYTIWTYEEEVDNYRWVQEAMTGKRALQREKKKLLNKQYKERGKKNER